MNRQEYNRKIISKLSEIIEQNPDLRFGQILVDCSIITQSENPISYTNDLVPVYITDDPFNEESEITWERMLLNKFAFKEQYN